MSNASEMGRRARESMEIPERWHLLAANTGERSQGMCGQAVEDNHSATTELEKVCCMACLVAEIREYRKSMKRIISIAEGEGSNIA